MTRPAVTHIKGLLLTRYCFWPLYIKHALHVTYTVATRRCSLNSLVTADVWKLLQRVLSCLKKVHGWTAESSNSGLDLIMKSPGWNPCSIFFRNLLRNKSLVWVKASHLLTTPNTTVRKRRSDQGKDNNNKKAGMKISALLVSNNIQDSFLSALHINPSIMNVYWGWSTSTQWL